MLRKIEHLLPAAMSAVETLREENVIKSGYQGALSGFGSSIKQMGLLPTLAVYADQESGADISRVNLMHAIGNIIKSDQSTYSRKSTMKSTLFEEALYLSEQKNNLDELRDQTIKASVALKLAIRTFKLD